MKKLIISFFLFLSINLCFSQNNSIKNDSLYYDSWVGEWYKEVDGKLNTKPDFVVKRGLYHSSFEEYWVGSGGSDFSMAWRAWDKRTQKWDFAWMSTEGLFQIWEGKKIDGVWYMYNKFIINGAEVLSRQAFMPQDERTIIRTSEHSSDNGNTWKLRFKETYKKNK
jgi:hypothetical protein